MQRNDIIDISRYPRRIPREDRREPVRVIEWPRSTREGGDMPPAA